MPKLPRTSKGCLMSKLFSQTLRTPPSDVEITSHKLLLRAGFIRQLAAGIFSYLPLAKRSMTKIENIMRDEMNRIGGQEITMPIIHAADLWQETGRWYEVGAEMGRFQDRTDRDMVLAMTHEEVVADLIRKEINSYRQLPALIYHIQTKWRDDPRPRAGLIRVREFTMLDSYSIDPDEAHLDQQYRNHYQAYFNIFNRCGLTALAVKSDTGMMGGKMAHEYMYLTPIGEDTLLICEADGYKANRQIATFIKPQVEPEGPKPLEKVETPDTTTIEALTKLLDIPESRTAKAVFRMATLAEGDDAVDKFVFAVIRGDMDVNETKLTNAIKAKEIRPATEAEIRATGAEPGYGSPIGVQNCLLVVDDSIISSPNLVAGANEVGYHYLNVNYDRDYKANIVTDISLAREGDLSSLGGGPMVERRGVEVGNIFKLGSRYTDTLGCSYLDQQGKAQSIIMGSYGIGVGRLLACVAEEHNDDQGLIWPITIAPYQVHLINLSKSSEVADQLYVDLLRAGLEVIYDERKASSGVKFNDADLIGLPLQVTVGDRSLKKGGVELKHRLSGESRLVPLAEAARQIQADIKTLHDDIEAKVVEVPFEE